MSEIHQHHETLITSPADPSAIETDFTNLAPKPLPDSSQLIVKFRHDDYRSVKPMPGRRIKVEQYIPRVLHLMRTGARALISIECSDTEERKITHQSLQDLVDGPRAREALLEIEDGILATRQAYRERLKTRQDVEGRLKPILESTPAAYSLTETLAGTYQIMPGGTQVAPDKQGLFELLVTPLEAKSAQTVPSQLLGRLALGEFDGLIAKDVLLRESTYPDGKPRAVTAPQTFQLLGFSRRLAASLHAEHDDSLLIDALAKNIRDWPLGAAAEVEHEKSSLHAMLQSACDIAVNSVTTQGWEEFGDDPNQTYKDYKSATRLIFSDWAGWPYTLNPLARHRLSSSLSPKAPAAKRNTTPVANTPENAPAPRNIITYVNNEGVVQSVDEFTKRATNFLATKDAEKANGHIRPIIEHLAQLDPTTIDKHGAIRRMGSYEVDGHPVYRLLLGQLQGVAVADKNLRQGQLLFSVNTSSAGGSIIYVHSLATSKTYQMAAEKLPTAIFKPDISDED